MLASVVISTYNRAGALPATLDALANQDVAVGDYEVLVVDDGSTDDTPNVLSRIRAAQALRTFRLPVNSGVSAGRNEGLRNAKGRYIIMISDDLIVPQHFIRTHIETHERFRDSWVVGGFRQLDSLAETPFGRYLGELELSFERARIGRRIDAETYEMTIPTARNVSMTRSDLERVGVFDEQFRVTCEDQDLAQRAASHGIRFIYNDALECLHNDQAADLRRYCRFQQFGARDTVRLCEKYPEVHGRAPIVRANGYLEPSDGPLLMARKLTKTLLATPVMTWIMEAAVSVVERLKLPDDVLRSCYRSLIGVYTFRGFREGLKEVGGRSSAVARLQRGSP